MRLAIGRSFFSTRSLASFFSSMARRSVHRAVINAYHRGEENSRTALEARTLTAAQRVRLREAARMDALDGYRVARPAAVKRNGGVRGSTATKWR